MNSRKRDTAEASVPVQLLHYAHSKIRAKDWRSPLVARLTNARPYADGEAALNVSYRPQTGDETIAQMEFEWVGLGDDYGRCINTYQASVLTEFATLGLACVLCEHKARIEITEVTRRGDKVDYWLGDRQLLLEVSGTERGALESLCVSKATEQLQKNPFEKDGFICVARFKSSEARLWFCAYPKKKAPKSRTVAP